MEKPKKPFSIYKRPTTRKGKHIYYVQFRDADGNYMTAMSTHQSSKSAAINWSNEYIKKGFIPSNRGKSFADYSKDFWVWDKCEYIKSKLARGDRISKGYAEICRRNLLNHILPSFRGVNLAVLKPSMIERWLMDLFDSSKLSAKTINNSLSTLRIMLKEAVRLGYIPEEPSRNIRELKETPRRKNILTIEEVRQLFSDYKIGEVWNNNVRHYTINLLSASTGMRIGECQGLQRQYLHTDHVEIVFGWGRQHGLMEPKNQSNRVIPIPSKTSQYLKIISEESPYREPTDFVFYGSSRGKPIDHKIIAKWLYRSFERIGITPEERKERNITFHSWRHFFNSICRVNVPDPILQRVTGHRTQEMTEHYTHFKLEDFRDVVKVQESIFES